MSPTRIYYIVPIENDKNNGENPYSPFQGFSTGLFNISSKIVKIIRLPNDIGELFLDEKTIIALRMIGVSSYSIMPIMKKELKQIVRFLPGFFNCIFSDEHTYTEVKLAVDQSELPLLHVTTKPHDSNEINLEDINRENILIFFNKVVQFLEEKKHPVVPGLKSQIDELTIFGKKHLPISKREHLVTETNERVLTSFNYQFTGSKQLVGNSDDKYVKAITDSHDLIVDERRKILKQVYGTTFVPAGVTLILTSAAMYRDIYRTKINKKASDEYIDIFNSTLRLLQKQSTYPLQTNTDEFIRIMSSGIGQELFRIRVEETQIYTLANIIIGCNNFSPTLRLPPSLNSIHPHLEQIGGRERCNGAKKQYKLNKLYNRISNKIEKLIPNEYIKRIEENHNHIKIVSDIPLEWLSIRDLPLMLRYETSRIPVTPGNLLFGTAASQSTIQVPIDAFDEVLIVRSFKDNDPIKNTLKTAMEVVLNTNDLSKLKNALSNDEDTKGLLNHFKKESVEQRKISIKWMDVSNTDDFIKALNGYHGPIMVFDGHGQHNKSLDVGSIVLKDHALNLLEIKNQVRIPPVVLLSACDTHPIDRSHASSANSFLIAGAVTVLGTFLPIGNDDAATFIARLILRLQEYLPLAAHKAKLPLTWSNCLTGLLRMSYSTEIINLLRKERIITLSEESHYRVTFLTNTLINSGHPGWYENFIELLSKESAKSIEEIKTAIHIWAKFSDCLKYIQLGNPEKILFSEPS